jgi:hypothetical protein
MLATGMGLLALALGDVRFVDVTERAGITFHHHNAATDEKYMVETMGSGGGLFDYDGDGDLDIYLLNGASLTGSSDGAAPTNVLYRNDGAAGFVDVTAAAGVGHTAFGMGMAAADFDNDGDADLYVTNFGDNVLYRNNGDGTFTDVTAQAGVAAGGWSASAAFGDADGDGFLDLFVCRYVDFRMDNHKFCGNLAENVPAYCHPDVYNPEPSVLFRNQGDGTFIDVTLDSGVSTPGEGKSLGVVWGDVDNDGDADIYVANDSMRNFLFENDGRGVFEDVTLLAGVGYSEDGQAQAGMGVDLGDYDGDGWLDIIVTNLDFEYNALYRGDPSGVFTDASYNSGLAEPSLNYVGFGTVLFDYDNDGWLDLLVANGHIIDNIDRFGSLSTYQESNFLFRNDGDGTFTDVSAVSGEAFVREDVARGAAAGDVDQDGDEDVLITRAGQTALLLANEGGNESSWLAIRLVGRLSNRDAVGARVTVHVGERVSMKEVKAGSSYLSQSALELIFGLADASIADRVEIRWPSGAVQTLDAVAARTRLTVVEGQPPIAASH